MNKIDRLFFQAGALSIILGFLTIGYVFMTFVYPYKVMEMNSLQVVNTPIPGGQVELLVDLCKFRETDVKMTYTLFRVQEFNGIKLSRYISDTIIETSSGKAECSKFIDPTVTLPADSLPGEYEIQITLSFEINKFKDVQYRYKVDFTI